MDGKTTFNTKWWWCSIIGKFQPTPLINAYSTIFSWKAAWKMGLVCKFSLNTWLTRAPEEFIYQTKKDLVMFFDALFLPIVTLLLLSFEFNLSLWSKSNKSSFLLQWPQKISKWLLLFVTPYLLSFSKISSPLWKIVAWVAAASVASDSYPAIFPSPIRRCLSWRGFYKLLVILPQNRQPPAEPSTLWVFKKKLKTVRWKKLGALGFQNLEKIWDSDRNFKLLYTWPIFFWMIEQWKTEVWKLEEVFGLPLYLIL